MSEEDTLKNYDRTDEALIRRLDRNHEMQKVKSRTANETLTRTIAAALKDDLTKQNFAKELLNDLRDDDGERSRKLHKYIDSHGMGRGVGNHEAASGRYWDEDGGNDGGNE